MAEDSTNYQMIRQRVERRFKVDFLVHLLTYLGLTLGLWFIYLVWDAKDAPWPLIINILWGAVVTAHGAEIFLGSGFIEGMKDREIEREIAREQKRVGVYTGKRKNDEQSKRKNDDAVQMRLSDEGELILDDEQDHLPTAARAKR